MQEWYTINNVNEVDTPALAVYVDRVQENIRRVIQSVDDINRLRPHVKTHKSAEVAAMMMQAGINKFKCATIAEAEMLAKAGAKDVLLAYQPVGPKAIRLLALSEQFPQAKFSCLVDNISTASYLSEVALQKNKLVQVYIDLNVGMNRTGITPEKALELYQQCQSFKGIEIVGLHAYDGHIRDVEYEARKKKCDEAFLTVIKLLDKIKSLYKTDLKIVAGGTPTFSVHNKRKEAECSPGTYIYWDKGYEQLLPEQQYLFAALVITRVISKPADNVICVDLGHKAIASENALNNRVYFLNAPDLEPIGHSEEHMVFKTDHASNYNVGDVLYGVPHHICPTVALHDRVAVVQNGKVSDYWQTLARNRKITI